MAYKFGSWNEKDWERLEHNDVKSSEIAGKTITPVTGKIVLNIFLIQYNIRMWGCYKCFQPYMVLHTITASGER